jgi:hypothetical protein
MDRSSAVGLYKICCRRVTSEVRNAIEISDVFSEERRSYEHTKEGAEVMANGSIRNV